MKITGGEAIMESLLKEGVNLIFGYPGGAIMPSYDALYKYKDRIRHILVRHEQGATHAAEGFARVTGRVGVCIATSGPGATNLVTGIADAMLDCVPLVCITGQVGAHLLGSDAFQEVDVIGITAPITKWNYQITRPDQIPDIFAKAFHIARTGRPGPVLIDITKNAQIETLDFVYPQSFDLPGYAPTYKPLQESIQHAAQLINQSVRPYILAGHGILISQAEKELLAMAEKAGIPVACTLHGLSSFPTDHALYVGFLGMHGNYGPNLLTNKADVIIALGMRFDDRVTGRLSDYAKQAKIIHIDIDPAEIHKNVHAHLGIAADVKVTLQMLLTLVTKKTHKSWVHQFRKCDAQEINKVIEKEIHPKVGKITMAETVQMLSDLTAGEAVVVADVGQHQMVAARYYKFKYSRSWISSGGAGTMGFGVPAAIGACLGAPGRIIVAIVGDGGFQMTIQELGTIAQENLPVKILLLNNNFLGMVRQWQQMFYEKRYSFVQLDNPDFIHVANGFRIPGKKITKREELKLGLKHLLKSQGPFLLEVVVGKEDNVFPMMPTGASVEEMRLE